MRSGSWRISACANRHLIGRAALSGVVLAIVVLVASMPGQAAAVASRAGGRPERSPHDGFEPSIGLTRAQVEAAFRAIAGKATVFEKAGAVKGVPRVLGHDSGLFTLDEILGYPEVVDVQTVTVLDVHSKKTLERQVMYDSLVCGELSGRAAQAWCLGRVLNTNKHGLETATSKRVFGALEITARTYRSSSGSAPPIVDLNISAP